MRVNDILDCLCEIAPLSWQEDYDNAGLQVGDPNREVDRALIALDVTEDLVDEAIAKSCGLILSHHPLIFRGLKRLSPSDPVQRAVTKAVKHDIAVVSMHTNLDNSMAGVNACLARRLGLGDIRPLQPLRGRLLKLVVFCPVAYADRVREAMFGAGAGCVGKYDSCSFAASGRGSFRAGDGARPFVGELGKTHFEEETRLETVLPDHLLAPVLTAMLAAHPYEEAAYDVYPLQNPSGLAGSGVVGTFAEGMTENDFLALVAEVIGTPCLRHSPLTGRTVKKVALCGGAGAFLLPDAMRARADAFLSAEFKYHEFSVPDGRILAVDGGHFETEQFTKDLIRETILKKFPNFAAEIAETNTNSVHYFVKDR